MPEVEEGVVEVVGRDCESRDVGVPAKDVEEDDSRFSCGMVIPSLGVDAIAPR
jgi:hypothetical protein